MWTYNYNYGDELYHHGVKGMRWGHRKAIPAYGVRRAFHKVAAANYGLNESYYSKKSRRNSTMASMNRSAKNRSLAKAKRSKGVRKAFHKVAAANYGLNESFYNRRRKRYGLYAVMNRHAKNGALAKTKVDYYRKKS